MKLRTMVKVGGVLFTVWRGWRAAKKGTRRNVKARLSRLQKAI